MYKFVNGKLVEMTEEEVETMRREHEQHEKDYWTNISYGDAVNEKIRDRYSESQELAILRQRDEKPDEYAEYFAYCEECKSYVKQMKAQYE